MGSHKWRIHTEKGRKHDPCRNKKPWNKGLTKESDERVLKSASSIKEAMKMKSKNGDLFGCCTKEYLSSELHKINASKGGGYRERAGTSKGGYRFDSFGKKVYLQSSYELRYADWLDKNNIKWNREGVFQYSLNGKAKKYYPDFYLVEKDLYVDTKNEYLIKIDKEKITAVRKQNEINLLIISGKELTLMGI